MKKRLSCIVKLDMPPKSPENDIFPDMGGIRLGMTDGQETVRLYNALLQHKEIALIGVHDGPFMSARIDTLLSSSGDYFDFLCELHVCTEAIDSSVVLVSNTIGEVNNVLQHHAEVEDSLGGFKKFTTPNGSRLALGYIAAQPESIFITTGLNPDASNRQRLLKAPRMVPDNFEIVLEDCLELLSLLSNVAYRNHNGRESPDYDIEMSLTTPKKTAKVQSLGKTALKAKEARQLGGFEIENPNVSFDDIGGNQFAKNQMIRLALLIANPEVCRQWGTNPPKGLVLHGPPGTGKTLMVRALASEAKSRFLYVRSSDIFDKYVGNSEKNIDSIFQYATHYDGKTIIYFDELDSLAPKRSSDMHETTRKVLNIMLQHIDGIVENDNITVVASTNRLEDIDPAFIRSGRLGEKIAFALPDNEERQQIFAIRARIAESKASPNNKLFEALDLERIGRLTEGLSGADIALIINEALNSKAVQQIQGVVPSRVSTDDIVEQINIFLREQDNQSKKTLGYLAGRDT